MGSHWRGLHACMSLVWRQMWADWIVEIWTSVKDYLPEIISAGEAWPLVQRWLQVKRQLWGDLAGPVTGAPSPHFSSFSFFSVSFFFKSDLHRKGSQVSAWVEWNCNKECLQDIVFLVFVSRRFTEGRFWKTWRQERPKANILSRQIQTEYLTSQSKLRFPKSRVMTALKKKTLN